MRALLAATTIVAGSLATIVHAGAAGQALDLNCKLIVPAQPLSAKGLATPYLLTATRPADGPCHEANPAQAAFVQAGVFNPATGALSIYNPLVIDSGSRPAIPPVLPSLPAGAVVGIWFGSNAATLTLGNDADGDSLKAGHCVNGDGGSLFGQFAYCNAADFFRGANSAIAAGKLKPPALGTARDGLPCPTVRDFAVVDQDQSDNVTTTYLVTPAGAMAQATASNQSTLGKATVQKNGSDNRLVAIALDTALGCTPWRVADLADAGRLTAGLPLNELQAAAHQVQPVALVPGADPMALVNGKPNLDKMNSYRVGVDQPTASAIPSLLQYCRSLRVTAPARIGRDAAMTKTQPSPDPAAANSLFTFLAQRFVFTYGPNGLDCGKTLGKGDPVTVKTNADGVAVSATIRY